MKVTREYWEEIAKRLNHLRGPKDHFLASLAAEESQFIRMNGGKVRQTGVIETAQLDLTWIHERADGKARVQAGIELTGLRWQDEGVVDRIVARLKEETAELPTDPYVELPVNRGSSNQSTKGQLLDRETAVKALLEPAQGLDFVGIYAAGPQVRAMCDSSGQSHWFETESYCLDFSLFTPNQKAVKGEVSGKNWDAGAYQRALDTAKSQLPMLEMQSRTIPRGVHRTYLAPAAVSDLVGMLSWGGISESAIQKKVSPLRLLRAGEKKFSHLFSLRQDFRPGRVPRFNSLGEVAPEHLSLIENGELKNTLISMRTAKEYGLTSNGAESWEGMTAPIVAHGTLKDADILKKLDTGLYLSNLHYLNWSDQSRGRITGLTRYACFWVENGKLVAPIETLRWDEDIFQVFGSGLEEFGATNEFSANTSTYFFRGLGGQENPGALLNGMTFTL